MSLLCLCHLMLASLAYGFTQSGTATLTYFESWPQCCPSCSCYDPLADTTECTIYSGCDYPGQFAALYPGVTLSYAEVGAQNIVGFYDNSDPDNLKFLVEYANKTVRLTKTVLGKLYVFDARVLDSCAGCDPGVNAFLVNIEIQTAKRIFGGTDFMEGDISFQFITPPPTKTPTTRPTTPTTRRPTTRPTPPTTRAPTTRRPTTRPTTRIPTKTPTPPTTPAPTQSCPPGFSYRNALSCSHPSGHICMLPPDNGPTRCSQFVCPWLGFTLDPSGDTCSTATGSPVPRCALVGYDGILPSCHCPEGYQESRHDCLKITLLNPSCDSCGWKSQTCSRFQPSPDYPPCSGCPAGFSLINQDTCQHPTGYQCWLPPYIGTNACRTYTCPYNFRLDPNLDTCSNSLGVKCANWDNLLLPRCQCPLDWKMRLDNTCLFLGTFNGTQKQLECAIFPHSSLPSCSGRLPFPTITSCIAATAAEPPRSAGGIFFGQMFMSNRSEAVPRCEIECMKMADCVAVRVEENADRETYCYFYRGDPGGSTGTYLPAFRTLHAYARCKRPQWISDTISNVFLLNTKIGGYMSAEEVNPYSKPEGKGWEKWTIKRWGNKYTIQDYRGRYLDPVKGTVLVEFDSSDPFTDDDMMWDIRSLGDGTVTIRSYQTSKFLRMNEIGWIFCDGDSGEGRAIWIITDNNFFSGGPNGVTGVVGLVIGSFLILVVAVVAAWAAPVVVGGTLTVEAVALAGVTSFYTSAMTSFILAIAGILIELSAVGLILDTVKDGLSSTIIIPAEVAAPALAPLAFGALFPRA